jgi:hypothetical protein
MPELNLDKPLRHLHAPRATVRFLGEVRHPIYPLVFAVVFIDSDWEELVKTDRNGCIMGRTVITNQPVVEKRYLPTTGPDRPWLRQWLTPSEQDTNIEVVYEDGKVVSCRIV